MTSQKMCGLQVFRQTKRDRSINLTYIASINTNIQHDISKLFTNLLLRKKLYNHIREICVTQIRTHIESITTIIWFKGQLIMLKGAGFCNKRAACKGILNIPYSLVQASRKIQMVKYRNDFLVFGGGGWA